MSVQKTCAFLFQLKTNEIIDSYEMPKDGESYIILYIPKVS